MKKFLKIAIILAVIGIVAAFLVYKFVYNKPHTNFEKEKAEFSLEAKALFNEFKANKDASSQKYNGKVVEITGNLSKIENDNNRSTIVFAFEADMFGDAGIRCDMLPDFFEETKSLKDNQMVTIKGFCSGYNDTDVILESCSIIKK